MSFIPSVIKWINTKRLTQIKLFREYPVETQQEVLARLITAGRDTVWGRKYGFGSVTTHDQFIRNTPVQVYDDLMPWVERLRGGEKNLLWPGEVKWFARSSGTAGSKSKFIPVTSESLEDTHYRGAKDCLVLYTLLNPDTRIFLGKNLTLGGSHQINSFSNNSLIGDLSAILIANSPGYAELIRTPPARIALIEDFETKMRMITEKTVEMNITSISGVPSWYLVLIRHILATTGREHLHQVWPHLEVFFHGGLSFAPYREQYLKLLPDRKMNYMETYNASEGFFAIQDDLADDSMLLMLDYGVYYEFIQAGSPDGHNGKTLTVGEVERGVNYEMIISTDGGLWRYAIGDTVEFTSLYPHKIRVTGRTKLFINAFGEEMIIDNAEKALEKACQGTGAHINEYTAGPIYMDEKRRGAHEWVIEFNQKPDDIEHFTEILDTTLKALNSDYEAKRYKDLTLARPVIRSLPQGTFYKWFSERDKLGGQNKVPRLSNGREYVESVLKTAGM